MSHKLWMHTLLLVLCLYYELQSAACTPRWMRPQFPCDVSLNNASEVLFDCRGRRLTEVPLGITSNASELILSQNLISNITFASFSGLQNLTRLNLGRANSSNWVNIAPNAFKNLTKLRELRLSGNSLTKIPENIPASVTLLELNKNKIMMLDNQSLAGLTNVTHFWFSRNCYFWNPCNRPITVIDNSFAVMTKLETLDLSFNNMTKVPRGLPESLTTLMLGTNQIPHIFADDFLGLPNLIHLHIQGNCPRCHNAPYPCVPCKNISISIHPNAFDGLTKLEFLHLGGNSLTYVNPSWFKNLRMLEKLILSFNLLIPFITTKEATFLKHLRNVQYFDLSFNFALQNYPRTLNLSEDFSNLVALKTLHMEGMVFQNIELQSLSPLYELKNLSALNLGTNFIIHMVPVIFQKFSHLKMIYLAENRLYPIPEKNSLLLGNGHSQGLDLSISPLTTGHPKDQAFELTHSLIKQECFDAGRVIILSSNNLFFITPKQFENFGNISCLNLSGNGFSAALNGTEFSLLPNLTYLDLSNNKIDLAYDNAFKELQKLQVLDLSHNSHYFTAYGVTLNLNFTKNLHVLRVLNMSHNSIHTLTTKQMHSQSLAELRFTDNSLGRLWKKDGSYKMLFTNLTNLTILDISRNNIKKIPKDVYKHLPRSLTTLLVSNNKLTEFIWEELEWFPNLKTLDLSINYLTNIKGSDPNFTHNLTLLDLSHNHIFEVDSGFLKSAKCLTTLSLSSNRLTILNQSTYQVWSESPLKTLFLQKNPFHCTCDLLDFILWIESTNVKIPGLITNVLCATPENEKNQVLIKFKIDQCVNNSEAFLIYILTFSFISIFMIVATVTHLFYWDVSYILHYMMAKIKKYRSLNSPDSAYDVFVTYDTRDPHLSEWVMGNLRVKLEEEGEKHLPLCLEERDWPPGVPLVENLTQSIRYSRKTLFVLTKTYVKTGAFRLAMYLAHQRLLDENVDVIVLLMLEPVLQHSHFLRLRRRLCGESVVEWPRTAAAEPWFWQNLRNVVRVDNQVMYNKTYTKYFSNN